MIPTGNVREYLIQKSSRSYLQQFTDLLTKFLVIEIETTEIDSFLMPDRNNKAPVWVEGGLVRLQSRPSDEDQHSEVRMPISVPVANLEHSRMCPTTSTTSAMRMRTTNALAFRQCLALSCFLPIRSPSCLRTFFHPNTISAVAFTSSIRSFVVRRVTETGTLSTAGENHPLDIGDMQCCARQESGHG